MRERFNSEGLPFIPVEEVEEVPPVGSFLDKVKEHKFAILLSGVAVFEFFRTVIL